LVLLYDILWGTLNQLGEVRHCFCEFLPGMWLPSGFEAAPKKTIMMRVKLDMFLKNDKEIE